jgi:hypothetical protein
VNTFLRAIIVLLISLTFSVGVFAESDTGSVSKSGSETQVKKIEISDPDSASGTEADTKIIKRQEEIRRNIIDFALDLFRAKDQKTLQRIDKDFEKRFPDIEDRIAAYEEIERLFKAWKKNNKTTGMIKTIVDEHLLYIINYIEKKKKELRAL